MKTAEFKTRVALFSSMLEGMSMGAAIPRPLMVLGHLLAPLWVFCKLIAHMVVQGKVPPVILPGKPHEPPIKTHPAFKPGAWAALMHDPERSTLWQEKQKVDEMIKEEREFFMPNNVNVVGMRKTEEGTKPIPEEIKELYPRLTKRIAPTAQRSKSTTKAKKKKLKPVYVMTLGNPVLGYPPYKYQPLKPGECLVYRLKNGKHRQLTATQAQRYLPLPVIEKVLDVVMKAAKKDGGEQS